MKQSVIHGNIAKGIRLQENMSAFPLVHRQRRGFVFSKGYRKGSSGIIMSENPPYGFLVIRQYQPLPSVRLEQMDEDIETIFVINMYPRTRLIYIFGNLLMAHNKTLEPLVGMSVWVGKHKHLIFKKYKDRFILVQNRPHPIENIEYEIKKKRQKSPFASQKV